MRGSLFVAREGNIKQLFIYGVFGVITTILNVIIYQSLLSIFMLKYWISNLFAILISKIFAYVTNKKFVFHSKCNNLKELIGEIKRFIVLRGTTGLIDYFGLILAVDVFSFDRVYSKYVLQIIVITLNYFLGKKIVFVSL